MEKKLRHLLSFAAALAFIIMAMASFGPDTSTHLEVVKTVCLPAPIVTVNPQLEVVIIDGEDPISGHQFTVFTNQQKITEELECISNPTYETYTGLTTDASGKYKGPLSSMQQNNYGDLIRVEVKVDETEEWTGIREVSTINYGVENLKIFILLHEKSLL